jgi:hypothetical protein
MKLLSCIVMVMICSAALVRNFLHWNKKEHKQQQELLPLCSSFPLFFICALSRTEQRLRALLQTSFKQLLSLSLC